MIDLAKLRERRRCIEEHGRFLRDRLQNLAAQRATWEEDARLLEGAEEFCASVREGLDDPSFALKQRVLQLAVDRIVVVEGRVVIHHVVPTGPVRLQTGQQVVATPTGAIQKPPTPR